MTFTIPLTDTTLDEREVEAAARVLRSGWLTMGSEVEAFEREFAAALGARHAAAVSNGTAALQLAYEAAGLRAGDEVLMPALTFVATLNAALTLGAKVNLVDSVSEDDLTLSADDVEKKLSPRTRMIVTMPYGGYCPDMTRIRAIAERRAIVLVEDACHAPLAEVDGRRIGTFGAASTWSFYGNKNLTTGEGGMVVTNEVEIDRRVRLLRSHGMTSLTYDRHRLVGSYDVVMTGYNCRMDEVRAAIGRVQLAKLGEANARRREATMWLREALGPLTARGLGLPFSRPRGSPAYHLFVVVLPDRVDREEFRNRLGADGIQTSVHYPALDRLSHARELFGDKAELPVVRQVENRLVTLPLGPHMTQEQVERIADSVSRSMD